jgi:hypothetical protein
MEKLRRKLTDRYRDIEIRTVWKCYCKIGTHNGTVAYFFEQPEEGKIIECVHCDIDPISTKYRTALLVMIDEVRDDGFVFCSKV